MLISFVITGSDGQNTIQHRTTTFQPQMTTISLLVLLAVLFQSLPSARAFVIAEEQAGRSFATTTTVTALRTFAISTQQEILRKLQHEHDLEIEYGCKMFGDGDTNASTMTATATTAPALISSFTNDDDFDVYKVPMQSVGPEASSIPKNADCIFQSRNALLSFDECNALIDEARNYIEEDDDDNKPSSDDTFKSTKNSRFVTNRALGEARVSQLPKARQWLQTALVERFEPLLQARFGVENITLQDALIVGYGSLSKATGGGAKSQPVHRDSSLLSINVALSARDEYNGGGTFFEALPNAETNCILQNAKGHVLTHASSIKHAGRGIESGERWVLVLFGLSKDYPQLSRRCHAQGMIHSQQEEYAMAAQTYQAGLSLEPHDHLLHMSLGNLHMAQGRPRDAAMCLMRAASHYQYCGQANLALGRFFMQTRRPRAALRRFQAVLELLENHGDMSNTVWLPWQAMGWDARVYGSQATLMCAQYSLDNGKNSFDSRKHLKLAQKYLEECQTIVPQDVRVEGMLVKTIELSTRCSSE